MEEKKCNCKHEAEHFKGDHKNCWDFHNCAEKDRKDCEVFKNDMGKECWFIPHFTKRKKDCMECGWFQKFNEA